ncbi:MAG: hypothetical protein JO100_10745 [Pseudonocardia sp.]|jgi:hypothetical protein|nr:hypothetical protein [Pseudonocardia sp.]
MSTDNPVADQLLTDARKKTARLESPKLAQIALIAGAVGLIGAWLIPLIGWVLGVFGVGMASVSIQRKTGANLAKIALVVGGLSILLGTFRFTLLIS